MDEIKHRRWLPNPGALSAIDEHNALYDAWKAATAEVERMHDAYIELPRHNGPVWRCGNSVLFGQDVAAIEEKVRFREPGDGMMDNRDQELSPAPVADLETLDDLAKIAFSAFYSDWDGLTQDCRNDWRNAAVAILRAARPTLCDIDYARVEDLIAQGGGANYAPLWDYIESRIRYRVEIPADDTNDIATAAYMLGRHDNKTAECPTCARVRKALEFEQ